MLSKLKGIVASLSSPSRQQSQEAVCCERAAPSIANAGTSRSPGRRRDLPSRVRLWELDSRLPSCKVAFTGSDRPPRKDQPSQRPHPPFKLEPSKPKSFALPSIVQKTCLAIAQNTRLGSAGEHGGLRKSRLLTQWRNRGNGRFRWIKEALAP